MIRKPNEDLFKQSTMTFGEHLEELRVCLFKSLFWVVIGVLLGLTVARYVVNLINSPMESALRGYYSTDAKEKFLLELEKKAGGVELPYTTEQVVDLVDKQGLLFEIHYVNPQEVIAGFQSKVPNSFPQLPTPEPAPLKEGEIVKVDLVPIFFWHRVADDQRIRLTALNAQEGFMIWMKAAFVVGFLLASPMVFWNLWSFVAAGLYPHEKRYVHVFLPFSIGLFLFGACGAFVFVFQPVLEFLFGFNRWLGIEPDPRISEWLGFVLILPIGFGISFQLPLVMLFMERIGIFNAKAYLEKWRIAILAIFVISMILTPADPYSMLLMAVPLTFLYFGGVLLCKYLPKGRNPFNDAAAA